MGAQNSEGFMSNLPSTEQMLEDLSKVKGLDFFFQSLAMMAHLPGLRILTEGEARIVEGYGMSRAMAATQEKTVHSEDEGK